ncbi:uncharacterized protein LOC144887131 [Branchiostoma floridae x Branchiostoma japonicum]
MRMSCQVCVRQFRPKNLARHMRTHTGEHPYNCGKCSNQFSLFQTSVEGEGVTVEMEEESEEDSDMCADGKTAGTKCDKIMEGSTLSERDGHYKDSWKPEGFDTKQVFVSPSIHYAGLPAYAKASSFTHRGTNYEAKVALQLYIKPGSYKVSASMVARKNIDKKFSDSEIEWSTDRHGVIIVYGLLVKLDEK